MGDPSVWIFSRRELFYSNAVNNNAGYFIEHQWKTAAGPPSIILLQTYYVLVSLFLHCRGSCSLLSGMLWYILNYPTARRTDNLLIAREACLEVHIHQAGLITILLTACHEAYWHWGARHCNWVRHRLIWEWQIHHGFSGWSSIALGLGKEVFERKNQEKNISKYWY